MQTTIILYSSAPTAGHMRSFADYLSRAIGTSVALRSLAELARLTVRRHALRVERLEVVENLNRTAWCLEQYRAGQWQPDFGEEAGLQYDLDAFQSRLRAIDEILKVKGGRSHE